MSLDAEQTGDIGSEPSGDQARTLQCAPTFGTLILDRYVQVALWLSSYLSVQAFRTSSFCLEYSTTARYEAKALEHSLGSELKLFPFNYKPVKDSRKMFHQHHDLFVGVIDTNSARRVVGNLERILQRSLAIDWLSANPTTFRGPVLWTLLEGEVSHYVEEIILATSRSIPA
jgi:hypothetical protein